MTTPDEHGGRVERRRLRTTTRLNGYLDWPGVAQVGLLERTVAVGGEVTVEVQPLITSVPPERAGAAALLGWARGHWGIERDFHLLKDAPLGIRPKYVRLDDQLTDLAFLLLAPRVLSLCEVLVWRGQRRRGDRLAGLYPGQPGRTTERPPGLAVLRAVAQLEVTLTRIQASDRERWHPTTLPPLVKRVLEDLGLEESWYTRLVDPAP